MPDEFGGIPVESAPKTDEFGGIAIGSAPNQGPDQSFGTALREYGQKMGGMVTGLGQMVIHPIQTIKNLAAQNEQLAQLAEDAYHKGDYKGAARHATNYVINTLLPGMGGASDEAGTKLEQGDIAGGLADTAALGTQVALGIKTPAIANTAGRLTSATAAGIKAAAPDVGTGLLKIGAGEAVGRIPGMQWPARVAIAYPAGRDIAAGLKAGGAAFKESLSPTPIRPLSSPSSVPIEESPYVGQAERLNALAPPVASLDEIAQGFKYKDFASVKDPSARATIQDIANRLNAGAKPAGPQLVPPRQTEPGNPPSGQDIIRGSSNIPLSGQGEAEAQRLAQATAGQFDKIYTSPLDRAQATAKAVAATNPQAGAPEPTEALTPWYLGAHEGQPTMKVLDKMQDLIQNKPDEVPVGRGPQSTKPGQSFNDFKDEFLTHVQNQVENYQPGQKILNATHYRDTRVLEAWAKAGAPDDFSVDVPTMLEKGDVKPGDLLHLNPETMQVKAVPDASEPGLYFARHGATAWNAENGANPVESIGAPGPRIRQPGEPYGAYQPAPRVNPVESVGAPGPAYHGTDEPPFTQFDPTRRGTKTDAGQLGQGYYFSTDKNIARNKATLIEAGVNLQKPLRIAFQQGMNKQDMVNSAIGTQGLTGQALTAAVKAKGYDGVILDYSPMGYQHSEIVAFDPQQINITKAGPGGTVPQPPAAEVARLNAGAPPAAAPQPSAGGGMFLRNFDLDTMARALRTGLNKGSITKSQVSQVLNGQAQLELLRDQLGLKGRIPPNAAAYLRNKVF